MKTLLPLALAVLCTGCMTIIGPVEVEALHEGRQFRIHNRTGHDLTGAKLRGRMFWGGEFWDVLETMDSWPDGSSVTTLHHTYPVDELWLQGFSKHGRFDVYWGSGRSFYGSRLLQ